MSFINKNLILFIFLSLTWTGDILATPNLTSDTMTSGPETALSAFENPAQAGFLKKSQFFLNINPGIDVLNSRLVGTEAVVDKPFKPFSGIPLEQVIGGVYSINSRLKVGSSIILPGLTLPSSVLGTQKVGSATLLGQPVSLTATDINASALFFHLLAAYRLNSKLSIGIAYQHLNAKVDTVKIVNENGDPFLEELGVNQTIAYARLGVKFLLNTRISLGLATKFYTKEHAELSPKDFDVLPSTSTALDETKFGFLESTLGASYRLTNRLILLGQLRYIPKKDREVLSLIDLEKQTLDSQMGIGGGLGAIFKLNSKMNILGGAFYKPSIIGPGEEGQGTTTGFNANANSLTVQDQGAFVGGSLGAEFKFLKKVKRIPISIRKLRSKSRQSRNNSRVQRKKIKRYRYLNEYALKVQAGVHFRYSSVGIDEEGELPAAYEHSNISAPITLIYTFH